MEVPWIIPHEKERPARKYRCDPWLGDEVPGKISRGEEAYALLEAAYKVATHAGAI